MVRTHEVGFGGKSASLGDYEIVMKCGAGTYGSVYRAVHKNTRRVVALKKVDKFPVEDGFPVECKYLEQLCSSRNIVNMLEYFFTKEGQLVLVFEYMETDLWKIISGPNANVPLLQLKCIMKQLFEGLNQCHNAGIMHRDVKPSNLLFNATGVLKLADFGLTTSFVKPPYLSSNVVSLYYRPPELLLGSHDYGPEIDIWSAGCILVELLTNDYLFAGSNETDQLNMIFKVFGTPNERIWPGVTNLPGWGLVESGTQHPIRKLQENYNYNNNNNNNIDNTAIDLASKLLQLDPKKRISSFEALNHPWFSSVPLACLPSHLPILWKDKKTQATKRAPIAIPIPIPISIPAPIALPPNDYNSVSSQNQFYLSQNQFQQNTQYNNNNNNSNNNNNININIPLPLPQFNTNIIPCDNSYNINNNNNNNNNNINFGFDNYDIQNNSNNNNNNNNNNNIYNNFENTLYQNYYNMNNAFNFAMQFNYNLYNNNFYQQNNFNQNIEYYNQYVNQNNFNNNNNTNNNNNNNNNYSDQYNYYNDYYNNANLNTTNIYPQTTNNFNNNNNNNNNNYNNINNNNNNKNNTNYNFHKTYGYINNCGQAFNQYDGRSGYGKVGPSHKDGNIYY